MDGRCRNRARAAWTTVRFVSPDGERCDAIGDIQQSEDGHHVTSTAHPRTTSSALALSVHGLRKAYGDVVAVDGLDLEVRTGECFGMLGPNGAGKTTTIEICEGLLASDAGDVLVLGERWADDAAALRARLGIQLQETQLSEKLTVRETLQLFRSFYRDGRDVEDVIAVVQLEEKASSRVGGLSGGQKQRLAVACALVGDPELLFLDEPTTGLDPQSRRQMWELVERFRASGRSVVLTTHYMEEAERLCDRVAIVDHGHVIALGSPRELVVSLGAEHVVSFQTDDDVDTAWLAGLPGVLAARESGGGWTMEVSAAHVAVPALLAELGRRGASLTELRTHSPTLEDVFVKLTGRGLRDE
jgi:ABC-2 type transport system ATP-binding protein